MHVAQADGGVAEHIGPWRIVRTLGQGDFGIAYEVAGGDERFALKLCSSSNRQARERMRFEEDALREFDHPCIPRLIATGSEEDSPYLVMTLAPGLTLKAAIEQLSYTGGLHGDILSMQILAKVLSAVAHMHERGFVHRDIKDANVLATPNGESVNLIDFGFCKSAGSSSIRLDDSFWRAGSARFSPPSKLEDSARALPSHDVFAVGVIGYRLLTGDYPWSAASDQGPHTLRELELTTVPAPIIEKNSHTIPIVSEIIAHLLHINDSDRPSAQEALREVEGFLAAVQNSAVRPTRGKSRLSYPRVSRDPICGDIRLTEYEWEVLNTRQMNRLRSVKQLGLTNRVYHGADHSRFSHSVGCVSRVEQILRAIEDQEGNKIDDDLRLTARLYALTHDVTHIPFGHTLEDEFNFFSPHDKNVARTDRIVFNPTSELGRVLRSNEIGRATLKLFDLHTGTQQPAGAVIDLVSGLAGADVLDYIDRDAYFCGLDHRIDSAIFRQFRLQSIPRTGDRRLISLVGGKYGVRVDREYAILSILQARYALFLKVYADRTKIALSAILSKGLMELISPPSGGRGQLREEHLEEFGMGDDVLIDRMRQSKREIARWAADHILRRELPTGVYRADLVPERHEEAAILEVYENVRNELQEKGLFDPKQRAVLEAEIAATARLKPHQVMIYCPAKAPGYQRVDHWIASATDASPTRQPPGFGVDVKMSHLRLWELWVFVADADTDKEYAVAEIAQDRFGFLNVIGRDRRKGRQF